MSTRWRRSLQSWTVAVVALVGLGAAACAGSETATASPLAPDGCDGRGRRVCLIPIADYSEPSAASLVDYLEEHGIRAGFTENVDIQSSSTADTPPISWTRIALGVDALYIDLVDDPDVTVIALTNRDFFVRGAETGWTWGVADPEIAVISSSQLHQDVWGGDRDGDLRDRRVRKMLLRYAGALNLGLPPNDSPLSVLYQDLDGLGSLDSMDQRVLDPTDLPTPSPALNRWASELCGTMEHFALVARPADEDLWRRVTSESPVEEARAAAVAYLDTLRGALEQQREALATSYRLSEALEAEEPAAPWAEIEDLLRVKLSRWITDIDRTTVEVARVDSTDDLITQLRALTNREVTAPESVAFFDAMDAIPLDALVALADERECGFAF